MIPSSIESKPYRAKAKKHSSRQGSHRPYFPTAPLPIIHYTPYARMQFHVEYQGAVVPYDLTGLKDLLRDLWVDENKPKFGGLSPLAKMIQEARHWPIDYV